MSLLLPATSESNSFIQLSLKVIFGGGRGDIHTFSYLISPDSIIIAFGIQLAGSVSKRMIAFDLVHRTSILSVEQAVYRPSTPCLGVFSTFSACTMQDVVGLGQVKLVRIFVFLVHGIHGCKEYCLSFPA